MKNTIEIKRKTKELGDLTKKLTDEQNELICKYRKEHIKTIKKLSEELNIPKDTIRQIYFTMEEIHNLLNK